MSLGYYIEVLENADLSVLKADVNTFLADNVPPQTSLLWQHS